MKASWILAPLLLLVSCASTVLAPGAEKVQITESRDRVKDCKVLGQVEAPGPFSSPDDWSKQLQNAAFGLGGDTVFLTSSQFSERATGMAYRCEPPKP